MIINLLTLRIKYNLTPNLIYTEGYRKTTKAYFPYEK